MTKEEFTSYYAEQAGMTVREVLEYLEPVTCDPNCGFKDCKGWRMEVNSKKLMEKYNLT